MNLTSLDHLGAEQRLRQLAALLGQQLGLPVPKVIAEALARLNRAVELHGEYMHLAHQARAERAGAISELLDGHADLSVVTDVYAITASLTAGVSAADRDAPVVLGVLADASRTAAERCNDALVIAAGPVFDALHAACRKVIAEVEALPAPPDGLWGHPDPLKLLVRADGHESSISVLHKANDRWELIHQTAAYVRDAAGAGVERFEPGSSRAVLWYRNWRRYAEIEPDLTATHGDLRLWKSIMEGCEPGLWRPEDAQKLTAKETTFASVLQRTGFALASGTNSSVHKGH